MTRTDDRCRRGSHDWIERGGPAPPYTCDRCGARGRIVADAECRAVDAECRSVTVEWDALRGLLRRARAIVDDLAVFSLDIDGTITLLRDIDAALGKESE